MTETDVIRLKRLQAAFEETLIGIFALVAEGRRRGMDEVEIVDSLNRIDLSAERLRSEVADLTAGLPRSPTRFSP